MAELTYLEAIAAALRDAMRRDPGVFLLGEDIGRMGGAFKVTKGFLDEFGADRVIDMPLGEAGIVGTAIGAALRGMRPVAEMQFADFVVCAVNPLVTFASLNHWRTGTALPMVVRLPYGGWIRGGPFHSRCPEAWFYHVPGLKIAAPSTPADAYGLLTSAIRDPNPVLFLEHKYLYRRAKGGVAAGEEVPLGTARVARPGRDVSVVTYGAMVPMALEAAEALAKDGVEAEVLDLRSLAPLDREAVLATARKTRRVLVAHEDALTGGIGGDLAAMIGEHAFESLDAPVRRLGALDVPIAAAPTLEDATLPSKDALTAALRDLAAY
jgi:2-oxoisovalerate dehydrogenase E1 component beta subunit